MSSAAQRRIPPTRANRAKRKPDLAQVADQNGYRVLSAMSKNTSFIVGAALEHFIEEHVRSGQYATASEVVRAGLRALEAEETRAKAILLAIDEGRAVLRGHVPDLELEEPTTGDFHQVAQWLERVAQDATGQTGASEAAAANVERAAGIHVACARVATWLELRSRRRVLLLRLRAEEAKAGAQLPSD